MMITSTRELNASAKKIIFFFPTPIVCESNVVAMPPISVMPPLPRQEEEEEAGARVGVVPHARVVKLYTISNQFSYG